MSFERTRKLKRAQSLFCHEHGIGTVVRSRTGRTRGKLFAVVGFVIKGTKEFVLVRDGSNRPLSRPKLKSADHLETVCGGNSKTDVTSDKELRELIEKYR